MPPTDVRDPLLAVTQVTRELAALVETAQVGLAIVRGGRVESVNARGAAMLGRPAASLRGMEASRLFPDPGAYAALVATARSDGPGGGAAAECAMALPGGRSVFRLYVRAIGEDAEGWSFEDIAEQQAMERELRATKRVASAASEAKSHFLANMSHELRTPLNGILGMAQLLLDSGEVRDESREFLGIIRQSAGDLVRILGDLLDMSNVEAGRLFMMERPFDLRDECAPIFRNFTVQSHLRPFSFSSHIDADIPSLLRGDPNRTKQILVNLLANAFKYTRQGQVNIRVALWRPGDTADAPPPAGRVRIAVTVADTGIGIDPDRQKTIFEPFGIGEDYLTKKYSGAGLGLSIAKRLAGMMGGDIVLESEPGRGSTFSVTLEFGKAEGVAEAVTAAPAPPESDRPLRILLAEDEPVNRLFTTRALQKLGHTVDTAADGQEALFMLGRASYDLVLMDIQMPRLNGLDATRRIRSGQEPGISPAIPVVALSAYAMDSDQARGIEAGMDAYVTKPYDMADLLRAVKRVLSRQDKRDG